MGDDHQPILVTHDPKRASRANSTKENGDTKGHYEQSVEYDLKKLTSLDGSDGRRKMRAWP
jgi:hypothetical protein